MDPLPAEWRTFGEHPTGAPRSVETAVAQGSAPRKDGVAAGYRIAAFVLLLAGAVGLLGVAAVAWASQPAEVVIGGSEVPMVGPSTGPEALAGAAITVSPAAPPAASPAADIVVDVEGAVMLPGLQRLTPGTRVGDAIAGAGGFSSQVDAVAAAAALNLAEPLTDGVKILVPARGVAPVPVSPVTQGGVTVPGTDTPTVPPPDAVAGALIDLNLADSALLDTLPGIGPVTAAAIIAARDTAPFTSVEDLRTRSVVGPATYEGIRELVTVGG